MPSTHDSSVSMIESSNTGNMKHIQSNLSHLHRAQRDSRMVRGEGDRGNGDHPALTLAI